MSSATLLENQIKDKLQIKWVAARRLAQEGKDRLGISNSDGREDEVLLEALKIFQGLSPSEQEEMKLSPGEVDEPDWKRKAREQAEKREKEWDEAAAIAKAKRDEEAAARARTEAVERGEPVEEISGPKRVTRVTKTTAGGKADEEMIETLTEEKLDGQRIKVTKVVCCTIL